MKNKKTVVALAFFCLTIIIYGFLNHSRSRVTESAQEGIVGKGYDETYEEFRAFWGDEGQGYGLGFHNPIQKRMGERLIWNSTTEDLNLVFINATDDAEFLLKLFWNYEEVEFSVDGSEMSTSYVFESDYAEDYKWTIKFSDEVDLSSEGFIGYLTPVIFIEPNLLQKEAEFYDHTDYGVSTTQYVFSDDDFDQYNPYNIFSPDDFQSYSDYTGEFYGLNVTNDSEILNNPSPYITANKGEQVRLEFLLGDSTGEQIEEYLLFAVLGNEQAVINGQTVLPVHLPVDPETNEPTPQTGELLIDVPDEEGEYEFVAYAVPLAPEVQAPPIIENSFRITVVVE